MRSAEKEREEGRKEQRRNKDRTGERSRGREGGRKEGYMQGRKNSKEKICADWRASVLLEKDLTSNRCPALSCLILK